MTLWWKCKTVEQFLDELWHQWFRWSNRTSVNLGAFSCCSEQLIAGGQEGWIPWRVWSFGSHYWRAFLWLVMAWISPALTDASDCMVWPCQMSKDKCFIKTRKKSCQLESSSQKLWNTIRKVCASVVVSLLCRALHLFLPQEFKEEKKIESFKSFFFNLLCRVHMLQRLSLAWLRAL